MIRGAFALATTPFAQAVCWDNEERLGSHRPALLLGAPLVLNGRREGNAFAATVTATSAALSVTVQVRNAEHCSEILRVRRFGFRQGLERHDWQTAHDGEWSWRLEGFCVGNGRIAKWASPRPVDDDNCRQERAESEETAEANSPDDGLEKRSHDDDDAARICGWSNVSRFTLQTQSIQHCGRQSLL